MGNRKLWPDLTWRVVLSDLFLVEITLTLIMKNVWHGKKKKIRDRMAV